VSQPSHLMPPVAKKPSAASAPQVDAVPFKATTASASKAVASKAAPAKSAALAAVTAALAATAASAAPQKAAVTSPAAAEEDRKPRRWIVKKTLNKFKANLRSVPDYYLPKFIQLIAAEVAPRCDGDQQLSRLQATLLHVSYPFEFCVSTIADTSSSPRLPYQLMKL
jgi:hypothetical protein